MKLSDIPTHEDVLAAHLDADPKYRSEWERTALARAVAVKVIAYRAKHGVSQTVLARRLGMSQPAIARLESGEHNPTFPTLLRLSKTLGIEPRSTSHPADASRSSSAVAHGATPSRRSTATATRS